MTWSKNPLTYPAVYREIFDRLLQTSEPSVHTFSTKQQATRFEKSIQGVRFAMMHDKKNTNAVDVASYTTERVDDLTVRLCSINDTERARIGFMALEQRREQDRARGYDPEYMNYAPEPVKREDKNISPKPLDNILGKGDSST